MDVRTISQAAHKLLADGPKLRRGATFGLEEADDLSLCFFAQASGDPLFEFRNRPRKLLVLFRALDLKITPHKGAENGGPSCFSWHETIRTHFLIWGRLWMLIRATPASVGNM